MNSFVSAVSGGAEWRESAGEGEGQRAHLWGLFCPNLWELLQEELSDESLPEEARDNVLATVGQAKLLMAQKLAQFRGLCDKNIVS